MTHLDEGTIHAWLDGALSAADARDAEAHVAVCAECSAKVAEARGFVAGASRILTALDDVPVGVTPKRAPSTAPAIRQWRAAPWVTGIAATLVVAIGVATWKRQPDFAAQSGERTSILVVAADSQRVRVEPPRAPALQPTATGTLGAREAAVSRLGAAGSSAAGLGAVGGGAGQGMEVAASPKASAPRSDADERPAALAPPAEMAKKLEALPLPRVAVLPAPAEMKDAVDEAVLARRRDVAAAGCYQIATASAQRVGLSGAAKAAASVPAVAGRQALAVQPTDAPVSAVRVVQLDTTMTPRGTVVRAVPSGERIGVWYRVGSDSVRVDQLVAGAFTIPLTARVNCPRE